MRLASGSSSHTGLVRGNNEDSFIVDEGHVLFAVADGMGGHRGGEVASRTAVEALRAAIAAGRGVQEAITNANDAVIDRARGDSSLTGMGTTLTVLVVKGGRQLLIGHVGDSRAYIIHEGVLRRITDDHSLVEELVREGRLTQEQADAHPQRHVVTRALGIDDQIDVDLYTLDVTEGDRVVLCTDGLTTMLRERDVERIARSEPDPQRAAEQLVDAANAAGGEDNTSIVVVDVLEVDPIGVFDAEEAAETPSPARVMAPAPDVPEPVVKEPRPSWGRRIGSALLLFVPLVLVLAIAVGGVGWYARRSYYVGFAGNRVVIYKGVPGGVLGWDPTIDVTTRLTNSQLTQLDRDPRGRGSRFARQRAALRRPAPGRGRRDDHDHDHDDDHSVGRHDHDRPARAALDDPRDGYRPLTMALAPLARRRRYSELSLGLLVAFIAVGGYILVALADGPKLPPGIVALLVWIGGLYLVADFAVRRFAPNADGTLLPIAALLNAVGFVMITRLDQAHDPPTRLAGVQSVWVAVGIAVFVLTLFFVRDVRLFERYRYTILLVGLIALLLPLAPSIGQTINGARLWVAIGSLTFEPSEIAKVLLVAFFAAYLVDKRELLTQGSIRIWRFHVPSLRDLGPLLLAWGVALLVLAYEKDVGTSLLFFGVFAAMLYMATRRGAYVVGALILLVIGAWVAYKSFGHVRLRVDTWLDPWPTRQSDGYQIVQAQYALGSGGVAGTGLGLGSPWLIPNASTDFVFAAIGEELGLVGTLGVLSAFMLLVGSAYRIAVDAVQPFSKLFAAGIATILGFQTFLIVGGVTRVIPLTGITLPFVSYGGSSLVANFALLALLLRISDDTVRARQVDRVNTGIRRVGLAIVVLFIGLAAQLTYLQVAESKRLADDPGNSRDFLKDLSRPRGPIVSADDVVLARSVPVMDQYKYQRIYPKDTAKLFAHVVGYQSLQFGSVGVEAEYSKQLAGRDCRPTLSDLSRCVANRPITGTVVLNLSVKAQQAAADALAGRRGSVVVLDVRTGGVVAAYSNPTYDPTLLVSHDQKVARLAREFLLAAPDNPMLARTWRELYPPGSTFKTVSAATALTDNVDVNKQFPELTELPLPLTTVTLHNFGDERCGGSLEEGFIESCNTTFGQLGLDLGNQLAIGVERFGINEGGAPSDLDPDIVGSIGPREGTFELEMPRFVQAAIGQGPVSVTPMEMALVAEAVARGGTILTPQTANRVEDPDGRVIQRFQSKQWKRAMDPVTAATLRNWMVEVVNQGTGTAAQIPGIQVAGKTGTAETTPDERPHAWFIAFAPAVDPQYAISVLVEHGGSSEAETTGGRVAAPVAAQVLRVLLGA